MAKIFNLRYGADGW